MAIFLGVGLRPLLSDEEARGDFGDGGADPVSFLSGSTCRNEQALPFAHDPAPFLKKLQSGTCFHEQSVPLRRFPFIKNRQGFLLPSPMKLDGAGLLAYW